MSRLLVIENHHAGDAVLALPFIRGARRAFDEVAVCCTPAGAEIFRAANVSPLIIMESAVGVVGKLREFRPDVAASVWADSRLHVLMKLSGANIRAGLPMNEINFYGSHLAWRKRRLTQGRLLEGVARIFLGRLLTHEAHRVQPMRSHLEDWRQVAALVGAECDFSTPWIEAGGTNLDFAPGKIRVALHHGGRLATKRWSAERFAKIASQIARRGDSQIVAIKPPDCAALDVPPGSLAVETKSIAELIAVLAGCDILLCNDSLAAHLGAALGRKVVSIFGPGHPGWFAPHGNEAWTVKDDECLYNPCLDRCLMGRTICLENISEERVMAAVERCIASVNRG